MNLPKKEKKPIANYVSPNKFFDSNMMGQYSMNKALISMHAGLQEEMEGAPSLPVIEADNSDADGHNRDHDQASLIFKPISQLKQKADKPKASPMISDLSPNPNSLLTYGPAYQPNYDQFQGMNTPNRNDSALKDAAKRVKISDLFTPEKRNGFYNIDDMTQPMVDPLTEAIRNIE